MTVAIVLGVLLAVARAAREPLDDPDPAWQRPGFLDAGDLPVPAPPVAPGIPGRARPTVVFFERTERLSELCRALVQNPLQREATAVVVNVNGREAPSCVGAAGIVSDPDGALAAAYGMRTPRGGGPPVGYTVVDGAGTIRYRTLDPVMAEQLSEVKTIVDALP
ncbi:MAG: hypothetical protein ABR540_12020 [Acidimicrobiales bacterium]